MRSLGRALRFPGRQGERGPGRSATAAVPDPARGWAPTEERRTRHGDVALKRLYFLVAIAVLQLIVGSLMIHGAAAPVRVSQDVLIPSGQHHHLEFGILGTGRLSGNLSELQGRSFDLFVFDDRSYSSFLDGSNALPPLFVKNGTRIIFDLDLAGSGLYHVVFVDFSGRRELQVHLDLVVVGLKTGETILALVVLAGGLALVGASLMMNVWSWRRAPPAPDPPSSPQDATPDPSDDNTRVY